MFYDLFTKNSHPSSLGTECAIWVTGAGYLSLVQLSDIELSVFKDLDTRMSSSVCYERQDLWACPASTRETTTGACWGMSGMCVRFMEPCVHLTHPPILQYSLTLMLLLANSANTKMMQKNWNVTETLAHWYSSEGSQRELSNWSQHDRV